MLPFLSCFWTIHSNPLNLILLTCQMEREVEEDMVKMMTVVVLSAIDDTILGDYKKKNMC